MFCFARFCCFCLKKTKVLTSVKNKGKDNTSILDKITLFMEEVIMKYKIPDPLICTHCRDHVVRTYKFIQKSRTTFNILSDYADKMSENCKDIGSSLKVSMNNPIKKKKRKKEIYLEPNNEGEIYEIHIPLAKIIENSLKKTEIGLNADTKPALDLFMNFPQNFYIKQEVMEDKETISEYCIKTEPMNVCEDEFVLESEITVKEEIYGSEGNSSSPVDINNKLNTHKEVKDELCGSEYNSTNSVPVKKILNTYEEVEDELYRFESDSSCSVDINNILNTYKEVEDELFCSENDSSSLIPINKILNTYEEVKYELYRSESDSSCSIDINNILNTYKEVKDKLFCSENNSSSLIPINKILNTYGEVEDAFFGSESDISSSIDLENILNRSGEVDSKNESSPLSEEKIKMLVETHSSSTEKRKTSCQDVGKPKKLIPFPCPFCSNIFYSANCMTRHLSKNHNENRFNCNNCDLSFKSENVLKRHSLTHSNEIYSCKI